MEKHRFPLVLDLQLFADAQDGGDGDEEIEVELELEDDGGESQGDDDGVDLDSFFDDEEGDDDEDLQDGDGDQGAEAAGDAGDTRDQVAGEGKQVKGKNAVADAAIAERRKWQKRLKEQEKEVAAARRLMQQVGITDIDEFNRRMDAVSAQQLVAQGVPAEIAQSMASQQRLLTDMQSQMRAYKYDGEVAKLKGDPFFADIDQYREEFEEIAERTGQSLEDVYMAKRGRIRMKERESEIEAKVSANKQKRDAKKVITSPTGKSQSQNKSRVKLSTLEMQIAKASGMSPEEYAKFKKR